MRDYFNRKLELGDLVLLSMDSFRLEFGLIVSESEVFKINGNSFLIQKKDNVLLLDKNDLTYKNIYDKLVLDYNKYTLKFKIKASNDLDKIKVGDVFESNRKSGRYAIYLGDITLYYTDNVNKPFKTIRSSNTYVIISDDLLKNNGFIKSVFNEKLTMKLSNLLSDFTKISFSKLSSNGLLLQNRLSNEYVAKVGHINFILNSNTIDFENHGVKKRFMFNYK